MTRKSYFFVNGLLAGLLLVWLMVSMPAAALSIQWLPLPETATKRGNPGSILGSPVLDFKNAGKGGLDWTATGIGPRGGLGKQELWLLDDSKAGIPGTSEATTTFSVASNSVAFIMNGDHNDGYAQFFVDDNEIGIFDMFRRGRAILAVTGLELIMHSIKVVQLGYHHPDTYKADIAIMGGAAFNVAAINTEIGEPPAWVLFLTGLLFLVGGRVLSDYDHGAAWINSEVRLPPGPSGMSSSSQPTSSKLQMSANAMA